MFRGHPQKFEAPTYRAVIEEIVDGDTYYAWIDLGFFEVAWKPIRLRFVDTPEVYGRYADSVRGPEASEFVAGLIEGQPVRMTTERIRGDKDKDSLGRFIAEIEYIDAAGEWKDVGKAIIEAGHEK